MYTVVERYNYVLSQALSFSKPQRGVVVQLANVFGSYIQRYAMVLHYSAKIIKRVAFPLAAVPLPL